MVTNKELKRKLGQMLQELPAQASCRKIMEKYDQLLVPVFILTENKQTNQSKWETVLYFETLPEARQYMMDCFEKEGCFDLLPSNHGFNTEYFQKHGRTSLDLEWPNGSASIHARHVYCEDRQNRTQWSWRIGRRKVVFAGNLQCASLKAELEAYLDQNEDKLPKEAESLLIRIRKTYKISNGTVIWGGIE